MSVTLPLAALTRSHYNSHYQLENDLLDQMLMGRVEDIGPLPMKEYRILLDLLKARKGLSWEQVFFALIRLTLAARKEAYFNEHEAAIRLFSVISPYKNQLEEELTHGRAMHHAAYNNLPCLIRALHANGAKVETPYFSPLHVACSWNHYEAALQLINLGVNVDLEQRGITPLLAAIESPRIIQILLEKGADINFERRIKTKLPFISEWRLGATPVESAVRKEAFLSLKRLIEKRVRISPGQLENLRVIILSKIVQKEQAVFTTGMKVHSFILKVSRLIDMLHLLNCYELRAPATAIINTASLNQDLEGFVDPYLIEAIGTSARELSAQNWLDKEAELRVLNTQLMASFPMN